MAEPPEAVADFRHKESASRDRQLLFECLVAILHLEIGHKWCVALCERLDRARCWRYRPPTQELQKCRQARSNLFLRSAKPRICFPLFRLPGTGHGATTGGRKTSIVSTSIRNTVVHKRHDPTDELQPPVNRLGGQAGGVEERAAPLNISAENKQQATPALEAAAPALRGLGWRRRRRWTTSARGRLVCR